jgi:hypothetical protein
MLLDQPADAADVVPSPRLARADGLLQGRRSFCMPAKHEETSRRPQGGRSHEKNA